LAQRAGDSVELMSKNGQPLARYFPEIVSALAHLPDGDFVLDGELVVPLAGALSFDALQQRIHPAASRVALLARTTPARYLIFDLLGRNGESIAGLPLRERRRELERFAAAFGAGPELRLSPAAADRRTVDAWFARVGGALDGVVAKRLDLGGFRYAANDRARVGSLLLGLYDSAGRLDYIGFCSAFPAAERQALLERLERYEGGSGFTGGAPAIRPRAGTAMRSAIDRMSRCDRNWCSKSASIR
jgi:ATP-dependent DNA ligase